MLSDSREAWTFEKLFSETSALIVITSNTLVESDWKTKLLRYKQALHNLQGRNVNITWGKHRFDNAL